MKIIVILCSNNYKTLLLLLLLLLSAAGFLVYIRKFPFYMWNRISKILRTKGNNFFPI